MLPSMMENQNFLELISLGTLIITLCQVFHLNGSFILTMSCHVINFESSFLTISEDLDRPFYETLRAS